MTGRDPDESHRGATPLELLFDLTFVVAFGVAGTQLAHYLAEGHIAAGGWGFGFAVFAVSWAWINYSWFTSAYDTDDWAVRVATLVQMVGVIILTFGIPAAFASIDEGEPLDNALMVTGYVIMRAALVPLWLRAARDDPQRRRSNLYSAGSIAAAQVGWVTFTFVQLEAMPRVAVFLALVLFELAGPIITQHVLEPLPWHAQHLAERFGLLVIITLGEVVYGTVTTVTAVVAEQGWSLGTGVVAFSGMALAFAMWWVYYLTPAAEVLAAHRERVFFWAYGHFVVFASIAATGAGLHVVADAIEGEAELDSVGVALTVAIPVLVLSTAIFTIYSVLLRAFDRFHVPLFALSVLAIVAGVAAPALGGSLTVTLGLLVLSPAIVIVGFETVGFRHQEAALERMRVSSPARW
ncbi:low temperature requirement protein A [Naasia aerilata]|uniref:Membrane protein n=1 Tax=Naasia aerilata TaxID=1162966 RepID=A0ABM8GC30_9MICO|nr:low temperature requirement protein A [Naasia aerilata]BDZ45803.1 membrane protein [Naasia aerilata]